MDLKKGFTTALAAAVIFTALPVHAEEETQTLKIGVLSDTHYMSPTLIADTADYQKHVNGDRKMFSESDAIVDALLNTVKSDEPDVLLISGDLTKDGEYVNHQGLADKLQKLEDAGIQVYVVPGNHDVNNANGMDFSQGDAAVPARRTSQSDFKEIYKNFGYADVGEDHIIARYEPGEGHQAGGLSYAARPKEGYTIIAIDSARYSADNTESGKDEHETSGNVQPELAQWVVEQTQAAKERGDTVIGLEHHGMVPHFTEEPNILPMYLVNDYQTLAAEYADAGMCYIFTGHMHANDIATMTTEAGNTLTDIETGSSVTYPSPARYVTLTRSLENQTMKETMNVSTHLNVNVGTFTNPQTKETQTIDDITSYGREHGFSKAMLTQAGSDQLKYYLDFRYGGSTEKAFTSLVGKALFDNSELTLEELVRQMIEAKVPAEGASAKANTFAYNSVSPAAESEAAAVEEDLTDEQYEAILNEIEARQAAGEEIGEAELTQIIAENIGSQNVNGPMRAQARSSSQLSYYRDAEDVIHITYKVLFFSAKVKLTPEGIAASLRKVFAQLDDKMQDENARMEMLEPVVEKAADIAVSSDGHTLLDYVNYVYQTHLGGEEQNADPAWVDEAHTALESGSLVNQVIDAAVDGASPFLDTLMKEMTVINLTNVRGLNSSNEAVRADDNTAPLFEVEGGGNIVRIALNIVCGDNITKDDANNLFFNDNYSVYSLVSDAYGYLHKNDGLTYNTAEVLKGALDGSGNDDGLLQTDTRNNITDAVLKIVNSLGTDENVPDDNSTTLVHTHSFVRDRSHLEQAVSDAKALYSNEAMYDADTFKALKDAVEKGENLSQFASQTEIDEAAAAITDAIQHLQSAVSKQELEDAITAADSLNESSYTSASWQKMQEKLNAARTIDAAADATQAEIDQAAEALRQAVDQLVKRDNSSSSSDSNLPKTSDDGTAVMYRLYNPNSGEHFYTADLKERNNVIAAGWQDEGIGWIAPEEGDPVYRLYNANGGEHHYTMSTAERDKLIQLGWKDEGIGWYSDQDKRVPLYRQYNPNAFANNHNYTVSQEENDHLISLGWKSEGIGWYAAAVK
jgi:hypothetical protein